MTDQSSDGPMMGFAEPAARAHHKPPRTEFYVYFAIIFMATIPLAFISWSLQALRSRSLTDRGPIARAWSQARIITPMIFSA